MLCETRFDTIDNHSSAVAGEASEAGDDRLVLTPRADVHEDVNEIVLLVDLPGVPLSAVDINFEQNLLTVRGAQAAANDDGYALSYAEFEPCRFERSFRVDTPVDRDGIRAGMKNGVLRVTLPRATPTKARKIEVAAT